MSTIAFSPVQALPVRRQSTPKARQFSLIAALSTALELSRLVGDTGTVNAKTLARVRQQVLAA